MKKNIAPSCTSAAATTSASKAPVRALIEIDLIHSLLARQLYEHVIGKRKTLTPINWSALPAAPKESIIDNTLYQLYLHVCGILQCYVIRATLSENKSQESALPEAIAALQAIGDRLGLTLGMMADLGAFADLFKIILINLILKTNEIVIELDHLKHLKTLPTRLKEGRQLLYSVAFISLYNPTTEAQVILERIHRVLKENTPQGSANLIAPNSLFGLHTFINKVYIALLPKAEVISGITPSDRYVSKLYDNINRFAKGVHDEALIPLPPHMNDDLGLEPEDAAPFLFLNTMRHQCIVLRDTFEIFHEDQRSEAAQHIHALSLFRYFYARQFFIATDRPWPTATHYQYMLAAAKGFSSLLNRANQQQMSYDLCELLIHFVSDNNLIYAIEPFSSEALDIESLFHALDDGFANIISTLACKPTTESVLDTARIYHLLCNTVETHYPGHINYFGSEILLLLAELRKATLDSTPPAEGSWVYLINYKARAITEHYGSTPTVRWHARTKSHVANVLEQSLSAFYETLSRLEAKKSDFAALEAASERIINTLIPKAVQRMTLKPHEPAHPPSSVSSTKNKAAKTKAATPLVTEAAKEQARLQATRLLEEEKLTIARQKRSKAAQKKELAAQAQKKREAQEKARQTPVVTKETITIKEKPSNNEPSWREGMMAITATATPEAMPSDLDEAASPKAITPMNEEYPQEAPSISPATAKPSLIVSEPSPSASADAKASPSKKHITFFKDQTATLNEPSWHQGARAIEPDHTAKTKPCATTQTSATTPTTERPTLEQSPSPLPTTAPSGASRSFFKIADLSPKMELVKQVADFKANLASPLLVRVYFGIEGKLASFAQAAGINVELLQKTRDLFIDFHWPNGELSDEAHEGDFYIYLFSLYYFEHKKAPPFNWPVYGAAAANEVEKNTLNHYVSFRVFKDNTVFKPDQILRLFNLLDGLDTLTHSREQEAFMTIIFNKVFPHHGPKAP